MQGLCLDGEKDCRQVRARYRTQFYAVLLSLLSHAVILACKIVLSGLGVQEAISLLQKFEVWMFKH